MKHAEQEYSGELQMPRSRGAVSGLLLVILGAWGALIPFVGPYFNFAYTPDQVWAWTSARGWLEVLPGVTAVVGGLLVVFSGNRVSAMLGGWLAVLAGVWFVIGEQVAPILGIGSAGDPVAATDRKRALLEICYFTGLGALVVFVAGVILARTSVRPARDLPPVGAPASAVEPYREATYDRGPAVPSSALTKARAESRAEAEDKPRWRWRRQRAGSGAPD
ncbi:MAG: hypothetical protein PHQ28_12570 [Mycobacterium sp.]|nr:hypothetical protein [Mycobacterium sp.]